MTGLEPLLLAAGASAGTAATAGTIGTIASVGLTAASAFSSIQAGQAESQSLKIQARQADLNARTSRLEGKRQSLAIQEKLDADLASQNALFGARGVLQGEGSAAAAADKAKDNASRDINLALFNADIDALSAEQRSANSRTDASAAKAGGIFDAIQTVGSFKLPEKAPTGGRKTPPKPARKPTLLSGL